MKHLIIFSHLNPASFTKAIVDEVATKATAKGDEVQIIDLYGEGFNPVLAMPDIEFMFMGKEMPTDIQKYQEAITWADHLTIVYPMWWSQMPAMLKGFIDRVFSHGFAFQITENGPVGLLKGKTAHVYINMNTPTAVYEETLMLTAQLRTIEVGIFEFCGIKTETTFFGNVISGTDELRKGYLETIK
ncbi:NAD(P)H-dependent oxidoreductase [Flavobacterium marginilacus]|uniref:NAD(P)H-dependent oxidoreductase n=1 Tax=Flavobacterium marginilacus TaxID=3003256 RepID=UPI00248E1BC0|nr:NAD(P)H-dependent oxidoreductase [Flavobacterium marginilacus]